MAAPEILAAVGKHMEIRGPSHVFLKHSRTGIGSQASHGGLAVDLPVADLTLERGSVTRVTCRGVANSNKLVGRV